MGMLATRDHSKPDTTITGPTVQQRAKAFHSPPNMAFTPLLPHQTLLSFSVPKSDTCVTANIYSSVVFFLLLRVKLAFSGLSV